MNWTLFQNSMLVAGLTTLLSVACGLAAALWLAGLENRWRTIGLAAAIIALCLPPFLVANSWLYFLGQSGVWRGWLPFNIMSLGGAVWILALMSWPITLLAVLGAWRRLEPAQLESDAAVTGLALVRGLLLPLASRELALAAVLTFVLALNNFAVPAILQEKVFPAEVWVRFNTNFDAAGALWTSWPMVLMPLLLLVWFRRTEVRWPRVEGTVPAKLFRRQLGAGWFRFCGSGTMLLCLLAAGLPLAQIASARRTWTELPGAIAAGQLAVWHSFYFAAATATLCVALGLIGWRWPGGSVLWLPFLVPGVLLGIGMIVVFNRLVFSAFYQSAGIVILALGIRYLALGWNGAARAMRSTDRELTDAARLEGASRWQMLRFVHWPQISPQLAAAWYIIFLLCLWDVESIVLVVPPGGETLALRIFNLLHYGHNPQVNALCLALLALALLPLLLWRCGRWLADRRPAVVMLATAGVALFGPGCSPENPNAKAVPGKYFNRAEVIGTRGAGVGEFNKPRSVAVDRQDNVYVVDITGRVQKFSPDGRFILSWTMPQTDLGKAKGMGCDSDGNIIVVEPHYQRVNIFSPEGNLLTQWGEKGSEPGHFRMPRAVAVDSRGNYLVPEYEFNLDRVQVFSAKEKKLLRVIGRTGEGDGEFSRPEGICVDAADRIYVADSCNHRIQIFSPEGKFLRAYGKPGAGPGELSYPYDIRVDRQGRQYVCEFGNSRIQVFDADDRPLEIIGGPGAAPGQFSNPWSIAFDSKENLYVADALNHRVQKLLRNPAASERAAWRPGPVLDLGAPVGRAGFTTAPGLAFNRASGEGMNR